mmetsp:Transcript_991/g.2011  ORF Transcript_991/g.2011 Transcript_991/m.2011 type:complete len:208 (+) Transcript_991:938-1561(+)
MRRIPTSHKSHPKLLRLINRHLHTMRSNIQPKPQITIHQRGSITLLNNINGFIRVQNAIVHTITIDGLEPAQAMRVDATLVGLDENIRTSLSTLRRDTVGEENFLHELFHVVKVDNGEVGGGFGSIAVSFGLFGGGREVELHSEYGFANGENDIGGVGAVGLAVFLEFGGEGFANFGVLVTAGVLTDDFEEVATEDAGAHDGCRRGA